MRRTYFYINCPGDSRLPEQELIAFDKAGYAIVLNRIAIDRVPPISRVIANPWQDICGRDGFSMSVRADQRALGGNKHLRPIEACSHILERTSGMQRVTDDNMGSEWRRSFGFE